LPFKYRKIWNLLDKKASQKPFKDHVGKNKTVLIAGAGPCGLRMAINAALLGSKVVVLEAEEAFTRDRYYKTFLLNIRFSKIDW